MKRSCKSRCRPGLAKASGKGATAVALAAWLNDQGFRSRNTRKLSDAHGNLAAKGAVTRQRVWNSFPCRAEGKGSDSPSSFRPSTGGLDSPPTIGCEVDHVSEARRSYIMSRVPSKHSMPELRVRRALHAAGYRFRLHRRDLPGTPDIVLTKYRTALFVHGCFWHGHTDCSKARLPKTRPGYWAAKQRGNRERDLIAQRALIRLGWNPVVVWQCETAHQEALLSNLGSLLSPLRRES